MKISGKMVNGNLVVSGEHAKLVNDKLTLLNKIYGGIPTDPDVLACYYKIFQEASETNFIKSIEWVINHHTPKFSGFPVPAVFFQALNETYDEEDYKTKREPPKLEEGEEDWTEEEKKKFWDDLKKKINGSNKMPDE